MRDLVRVTPSSQLTFKFRELGSEAILVVLKVAFHNRGRMQIDAKLRQLTFKPFYGLGGFEHELIRPCLRGLGSVRPQPFY